MAKKSGRPVIAVHGGAWDIFLKAWPAPIDGRRKGCLAGLSILKSGGTALDSVEASVRVLETIPTFDAGCESFLNENGEVELDASIMDGYGGAILVTPQGQVGLYHNTPKMAIAFSDKRGK